MKVKYIIILLLFLAFFLNLNLLSKGPKNIPTNAWKTIPEILDFNKDGKLLGIEVLNASKVLKKDILMKSKIN